MVVVDRDGRGGADSGSLAYGREQVHCGARFEESDFRLLTEQREEIVTGLSTVVAD
ncbi:hypothetical protein [Streptomyces cyaneus]|uniref:hypothetical protein n=1 Tax=Streptomyces cyaneus TaxID=1904 RepID=UPI0015E8DE50|nr:hypothetical protein [Streptomyces cyaneus]